MPDIIKALARATLPPGARQKAIVQAGELVAATVAGRPVWPEWNAERAIESAKKIPLIYRSIRTYAESVASVPLVVERLAPSGDWEPFPEHDLQALVNQPEESQDQSQWMEWIVWQVLVTGNSLTRKLLASRRETGAAAPKLLGLQTRIGSSGWAPVITAEGELESFMYRTSGKRKQYPAPEMVHFYLTNPANPFWGLSPMVAAAKIIDTDQAAVEWNRNALENRQVSDLIYINKDGALTPSTYNEARAAILAQHQGARNARHPVVAGGNWEVQNLSSSAAEMDFIESRRFYREEQLSVYSMPPVMAGFFDNATLANAEVSRKLYWIDGVLPVCRRLERCLTRSLVPHFGDLGSLRLAFDTSGVSALQEDLEGKARTFFLLQRGGVGYDEAAAVVELPLMQRGEKNGGELPMGKSNLADIADQLKRLQDAGLTFNEAASLLDLPIPPREEGGKGFLIGDKTTALDLVRAVAEGRIPAESAIAHLVDLIGMGEDAAKRIIDPAARFVPRVNEPGAAMSAGVAARRKDAPTGLVRREDRETAEILALVDRVTPGLGTKVGRILQDVRAGAEPSLGAIEEVLRAIPLASMESELRSLLEAVLAPLYRDAAQASLGHLGSFLGVDLGDFEPDLVEPFAASRAAEAARQIRESTETGIRGLVGRITAGEIAGSADALADLVRAHVGINSNQAASLQVAWRDAAERLTEEQRVALVARLSAAMIRERAGDIAEAEAVSAANLGRNAAWEQAERLGQVSGVFKMWITAQDDRVCPICSPLNGVEVRAEDNYVHPLSGRSYPRPGIWAHPKCRCGEVISRAELGVVAA